MTPLLELRNVTKTFGGGLFRKNITTAVEDLSLSIGAENPAITAIAGESGSGKTTLVRLLLGMIFPTSGRVYYRGKDLEEMSRKERREFRREVQPIFQDPFEVYNPFYKVDHVFTMPLAKFKLARAGEEAQGLIESALRMVGLRPDETLGRYPHQLSGGQRQRVMVARALLLKPRIILADEPVSMVDASLRATILETIQKLNRELGISILYITHDLTTAYQIADNIVVLYRGSVVESGEVGRVIKDPQHPYTQLLVESIPLPNPDRRWADGHFGRSRGPNKSVLLSGCKFADRCPVAMEICREKAPPLYHLEPQRAAACFVHRASPVMEHPDVAQTFVGSREV